MVIDCSVESITVYANMYIKKIELYSYKNATSAGIPSDANKVLTIYNNSTPDTTVKNVRRCVSSTTLSSNTLGVTTFKDGLFYVRVTCDGSLGSDISQYSCGADSTVDIAIVPDWKSLYDAGMGFISRMGGCKSLCDDNFGYEQFILNWFAIRLAISACDYDGLAAAWDRFFRLNTCTSNISATGGCGCR